MMHFKIIILFAAVVFNYASPVKEDAGKAHLPEGFHENRGEAARQGIGGLRSIFNYLQRRIPRPALEQVIKP